MGTIRVLIVDDSAFVRQVLTETLSSDPSITVVGAAPNPIVARDMIKALNPDVLTLDIEMPRMDGLSFLEKIMTLRPMPVLMISSLTQKGADIALQALEMGAVDFVAKPTVGLVDGLPALREEIVGKIKAAMKAKIRPRGEAKARPVTLAPGMSFSSSEKIIAVGASTGGVEALQELLTAFPSELAGDPGDAAHAGNVHGVVRQAAQSMLCRQRQPGEERRARAAGPRLYRARWISSRTGA